MRRILLTKEMAQKIGIKTNNFKKKTIEKLKWWERNKSALNKIDMKYNINNLGGQY